MLRIIVVAAVMAISVGIPAANAEPPSHSSKKSPGEIAAISRRLAGKQENCRIQAKEQKLRFFKRRSFIRKCMKAKT